MDLEELLIYLLQKLLSTCRHNYQFEINDKDFPIASINGKGYYFDTKNKSQETT